MIHRGGGGKVLRNEEAPEDPLKVAEDLLGMACDGHGGLWNVVGEEDRNWPVQGISVEEVGLDWPFLEENRRCCIPKGSLAGYFMMLWVWCETDTGFLVWLNSAEF